MNFVEFKELRNIVSFYEIFSEDDFIDLMEAGDISYELEKFFHDNGWDRMVDDYAKCNIIFTGMI